MRTKSFAFPDETWTKLKYTEYFSATVPAQPGATTAAYRGNSAFDPDVDVDVSGTQPLGFDQWGTFYNRYYVAGSRCKVKVYSASTTEPIEVNLWPSIQQPGASEWLANRIWEQPFNKSIQLSPTWDKKTIASYMNTAKMYGVRDPAGDVSFSATVANNPVKQWYWNFMAMLMNPTSTATPVIVCKVTITYYIKFMERLTLAPS